MKKISLIPVQEWGGDAVHFLYQLLSERPPEANISHKSMPSFSQHERFVSRAPYADWWLIVTQTPQDEGSIFNQPVGSCYITRQNEIGIQIARGHQRQGYARTVLDIILSMRRGDRLLANIAPNNEPSRRLFESFGFKLIQRTYELETE